LLDKRYRVRYVNKNVMQIPGNLIITKSDEIVLNRLRGFIPDKVFDIHAHLYDTAYMPTTMAGQNSIFEDCGVVADRNAYTRLQGPLYPGIKTLRLNLVSAPDASMSDRSNGNRARCNDFLVRHLDQNPDDVGEAFVLPDDSDEDIKNLLVHPNIKGFKCYHVTAKNKPTWQAEISEYLPESAWRAADSHGMCMTLHMVKDAALADPGNQKIITDKTREYRNAKLILAHAGRGFAAWTAFEGVKKLSDFSNIYFDVSAVCEPTAILAVLKAAGPGRVLWGSDFPVSMMRGKCISMADSFIWLDRPILEKLGTEQAACANLVGVESLNALAQACDLLNLSRKEVEDIFYNNAIDILGLRSESV